MMREKINMTCPFCQCDVRHLKDDEIYLDSEKRSFDLAEMVCENCGESFYVSESDRSDHTENVKEMPFIKDRIIFKYNRYYIKSAVNKKYLQDIAFAFEYQWSVSGKKYIDEHFDYIVLEPKTKLLFTSIKDSGEVYYPVIDMRGYIQLLNGIEPEKKPRGSLSDLVEYAIKELREWNPDSEAAQELEDALK